MEKVRLNIIQECYEDYEMQPEKDVSAERMALYVAKDRSLWLYDQEVVSKILNNRENELAIELLGKTNHVIIYPANEIFVVDDEKYVVGECLIMNLDKFVLSCMTMEETQNALNEYMYRAKTVCQGRHRTYAYLLN